MFKLGSSCATAPLKYFGRVGRGPRAIRAYWHAEFRGRHKRGEPQVGFILWHRDLWKKVTFNTGRNWLQWIQGVVPSSFHRCWGKISSERPTIKAHCRKRSPGELPHPLGPAIVIVGAPNRCDLPRGTRHSEGFRGEFVSGILVSLGI